MLGFVATAVVLFAAIGSVFFISERRFANAGYDRHRRPPRSRPGYAFDAGAKTLRGGARIGRVNASWPLATLTADSVWIRLAAIIGTVWIPRSETVAVKLVRGLMGPGVLFESTSGAHDGVIFWTFSSGEAMRTLDALGWPVAD